MMTVSNPPITDPHRAGVALCPHCLRRWVAVAPEGTTLLECPRCGVLGGKFDEEPI